MVSISNVNFTIIELKPSQMNESWSIIRLIM